MENGIELGPQFKRSRLSSKGLDLSIHAQKTAQEAGITLYQTLADLTNSFSGRRVLWLMLPAGTVTEGILEELWPLVSAKDIVIEGGNSNYKDSIRRAAWFKEKEVHYFDCGTSGGVSGARKDACLMIGGNEVAFQRWNLCLQMWLF